MKLEVYNEPKMIRHISSLTPDNGNRLNFQNVMFQKLEEMYDVLDGSHVYCLLYLDKLLIKLNCEMFVVFRYSSVMADIQFTL